MGKLKKSLCIQTTYEISRKLFYNLVAIDQDFIIPRTRGVKVIVGHSWHNLPVLVQLSWHK